MSRNKMLVVTLIFIFGVRSLTLAQVVPVANQNYQNISEYDSNAVGEVKVPETSVLKPKLSMNVVNIVNITRTARETVPGQEEEVELKEVAKDMPHHKDESTGLNFILLWVPISYQVIPSWLQQMNQE